MMLAMSPSQTVHDLLSTIPSVAMCCGTTTQQVSVTTLNALRTAAANACDEEECIHRMLAACRRVIQREVIRCQTQADADAAGNGGTPNARSEEALRNSRELLASIEARLGVDRD
jgi:hypothetical protein